ncbi:MAG: diacylglycerol kinase (ATP) [Bacteroidia bacterium]
MIKILVICNPFAGGGTSIKVLERYKKFALNHTSHHFDFYQTAQPADFKGIENEVEARQPDIISIVGGDGTTNEIINVPNVRLRKIHLVPAGSGNDFHRLVYGSISCDASFEYVVSEKIQTYDVGICNGRYFLNVVGIGFDGSVARETMRMKLPLLSSKWKYWVAIFKNVLFYRSLTTTVTVKDNVRTQRLFMIAIANGTDYGGGFKVSPESDASDGQLNLVLVGAISPLKRLFKIPKVQAGKHLSESFVSHEQVTSVIIESKSELHAHLDGEQVSSHKFSIQIADPMTFVV